MVFMEQYMAFVSELLSDAKFIIQHRKRIMPIQKKLDCQAPKVGDLAPDFTLTDSSGTETVTLSQFQGVKPVTLVFGSYT
jgi:peroxiredoxin